MNIHYLQKSVTTLITILLLSLGSQSIATAGSDQQCKTDIKALLKSYERALNASDVDKVLSLYAKDGVFMPSEKPTTVGQAQVKLAYQHVFEDLDLDIGFNIDEIERHGDIAIVRTVSDGQIKLIKKNLTIKNHTRELFVLKRINKDWKIYRYMFNSMSSPKH
ncbi:MAG: SgcJ/EcaC family oxidoreductase [Gammaproteobacteria bacterium]